ncbi:unnamed protein product [Prorocentrum cordatum]|uniref:Protein S-acyltransferase n=1 Tax=Prorocentrum cordatum TaxID=2364126 RepID=A0ABN9RNI0_9DINO|nr:unnamed protein product [Polarella glacialis]
MEGDIEDPEGWLLLPYSLSLAGAAMFLLMSIWMAMHAAVIAQSYEVRILTQLVRLPLPTWREIEACRTYASEFESVDVRQMLRVPLAMGRQDRLVRGGATEGAAAPPGARSADPWGFERPGEDIGELGSRHGLDVARLRHIRLTRQAMACWQSHDAFARICMNLGVHQLFLALAYFLCGYAATNMHCNSVYAMSVVILLMLADTILRLDMSLSVAQLRWLEIVLAAGPLTSLVAVELPQILWGNFYLTEVMMVFAYIFHGWFLKMLAGHLHVEHACQVGDEESTVLPTAFRSVLYLDVFGWFQTAQQADQLGMHDAGGAAAEAATSDPPPEGPGRTRPWPRAAGAAGPPASLGAEEALAARRSAGPLADGAGLNAPSAQ